MPPFIALLGGRRRTSCLLADKRTGVLPADYTCVFWVARGHFASTWAGTTFHRQARLTGAGGVVNYGRRPRGIGQERYGLQLGVIHWQSGVRCSFLVLHAAWARRLTEPALCGGSAAVEHCPGGSTTFAIIWRKGQRYRCTATRDDMLTAKRTRANRSLVLQLLRGIFSVQSL